MLLGQCYWGLAESVQNYWGLVEEVRRHQGLAVVVRSCLGLVVVRSCLGRVGMMRLEIQKVQTVGSSQKGHRASRGRPAVIRRF